MKREDFRELLAKPYLFHLHTRYTDGHLDVVDYFRFAKENDIKTIIFTEHVRRELKYDFTAFVDEIVATSELFPEIRGLIGAEAKLLPGGGLDIDKATADLLDVLCFACHGFPDDHELYFKSFEQLLTDDQWKNKIRVFVHPGRYLKKRQVTESAYWDRLHDLLLLGIENGVFIEDNKSEMLPPSIHLLPDEHKIVGYDIHHQKGLENWLKGEVNGI